MRLLFIFSLWFSLTYLLNSEEKQLEAIFSEAKSIQEIEGKFKQKRYLSSLKKEITTEGNFKYLKDEGLSWIVTVPYPSHTLINSRGVWRKIENKKDERVRGIQQLMQKSMLKFFTFSEKDLKKDFTLSYENDSSKITLLLVPKSKLTQKVLHSIHIVFNDKEIETIKVNHGNKRDYTEINFFQIKKIYSNE